MSDDVFLPSDGHETTNTDDSQNNEDNIVAKGNDAICVAGNATGIYGNDAWTLVLNRKQIRAKKLQLQQKDALGAYEGVVRRVTRLSTSA